jgi:glutamate dehydrogenase/leucine dehydrogenase
MSDGEDHGPQLPPLEGQQLHTIGPEGDPLGFVVIDSTIAGRARGGLRMAPELSAAEIGGSARAMTLKYGLLGLPQGGAKAGVLGDPEASPGEKRARLDAFARSASDLLCTQRYVPDADLGTRSEDIRNMMEALGAPVSQRDWRANRSGVYTAVSCLAAAQAGLTKDGASLAGMRVAVEGFGDVGSALASRAEQLGARVVAVSTSRGAALCDAGFDTTVLQRAAQQHGSAFVERIPNATVADRAALLTAEVDVLFPCARRHCIDERNATEIAAKWIYAGANDPISPAARGTLARREIHFLPDFVTNAGGVLGGTLEFAGVAPERVEELVSNWLRRRVEDLFDRSADDEALWLMAEAEALESHARVRAAQESPGVRGRVRGVAIEAYRRGWLPEWLVAPAAVRMLR